MTYWKPQKGNHPSIIKGTLRSVEYLPHTHSIQYEAFIDGGFEEWSVGIVGYKLKNQFLDAKPAIGDKIGLKFIGESGGFLECLVVSPNQNDTPGSFDEWAAGVVST